MTAGGLGATALRRAIGEQLAHDVPSAFDGGQQGASRRVRRAPALLPVAQGPDRQVEGVGELRLRHAEALPQRLDARHASQLFQSLLLQIVLRRGIRALGNWDLQMTPSDFTEWLAALSTLNAAQRRIAFRALALAEADDPGEEGVEICQPGSVAGGTDAKRPEECGEAVAAAPAASGERDLFRDIAKERQAQAGCPHCGAPEVRPWGEARGLPRYRCVECRKTFNPFTGTPVAGLHNKDRWPDQARALMEGESLAKAAERCGVHPSTAFRWRHRFLSALNDDKPRSLSGVVEADETFILESFKGRRGGLARPARRRGGKAAKRGLSAEQIPVIVARDRGGATLDAVLPRLDAKSLQEAFGDRIAPGTDFCCDGGSAITAFARRARLNVHVLPAPGVPKPEEPEFHINHVNAYHGRLKEWMRRFHGVATENLPTYLSWRRTLEALRDIGDPARWIAAAAGLGPYQHVSQ